MTNNTTEQKDKGQVKHTAGPWKAFFEDSTQPCSVRGNGRTVAWVDFWEEIGKHHAAEPEQRANARLIAAAPDLLEACKALFGLVESGHLVRDISGDAKPVWAIKEIGLVKALAQAREAIDRAEGKA